MTSSNGGARPAPRVYQMLHFPLRGAGAGVYALTLAQHLAERGYSLRALRADHAPAADPLPGETILFRGGDGGVCDLDFDFPVFVSHPCSAGPTFGALTATQRTAYERAMRTAIARGLAEFRPQIVHVHHGWLIAAILADLDLPYVVTLHGSERQAFDAFPDYRAAVLRGLAGAARVMAVSEPVAADAITTYGLDPSAVVVVPSGVDLRAFRPCRVDRRAALANLGVADSAAPVVLFSGRLIAIKGVDTLLHAVARCQSAGVAFTTLIAGDGVEAASLAALARDLDLDGVHFLGQQPHAALPALYNLADLVVAPSRQDALPLSVLEAQACGTPVVASAVGALPQAVPPIAGRIVPPDDEYALAEAIEAALWEESKRERGAAIARRARTAFSFDRTTDVVARVYDEALAGVADSVAARCARATGAEAA